MKFSVDGRFGRFVTHPFNAFGAEAAPLLVTFYVTIWKPASHYTLSEFFATFLQPVGVKFAVGVVFAILGYFALLRIASICLAKFGTKPPVVEFLDHPHLNLAKKTNEEIREHIPKVQDAAFKLTELPAIHPFRENIYLVLVVYQKKLLEKLESLSTEKIRARNLWLSLYVYEPTKQESESGKKFKLMSLVATPSASVGTEEIFLKDDRFKDWAGVRAITSNPANILCVAKCSKKGSAFVKGSCGRRKNIQHYFGVPIETVGGVIGLLNIEIHSFDCFATDEEMVSFAENELYGLRSSLEYQFLKKFFFEQLALKTN